MLERELRRAIEEGIVQMDENGNGKLRPGSMPLDHAALRGVPVIGRFSGGGAIAGTLPHVDGLRGDRRNGYRRRL